MTLRVESCPTDQHSLCLLDHSFLGYNLGMFPVGCHSVAHVGNPIFTHAIPSFINASPHIHPPSLCSLFHTLTPQLSLVLILQESVHMLSPLGRSLTFNLGFLPWFNHLESVELSHCILFPSLSLLVYERLLLLIVGMERDLSLKYP